LEEPQFKRYNYFELESLLTFLYKFFLFQYELKRLDSTLTKKMSWLQDVAISILFPYLLPSFPIFENECWSKEDIRGILEELLIFYCSVSVKKIQELLENFVKRVLSSNNKNLDHDLYFLADIKNRCSYGILAECESSVYSLYVCSFLIQHGLSSHKKNNYALQWASRHGHKDSVALLLEHKADVHTEDDCALIWSSERGHKDTVTLLLEHKADVHTNNNNALVCASKHGHKDIVSLLLQHKADIHANNNDALQWASQYGHKDTVALLLEHKADIHADGDCAFLLAAENGHEDTVALLLEHKADVHAADDNALELARLYGYQSIIDLILMGVNSQTPL
jgi:hypothetical protein